MKLGIGEVLIILVVILFIVGPDKIPDFARKVAEGLKAFRNATSGVTKEIRENVIQPLNEASAPLREAMEPINEIRAEINDLTSSLKKDAQEIADSLSQEAQGVTEEIKEAGSVVTEGIKEAGSAMKEAAEQAVAEVKESASLEEAADALPLEDKEESKKEEENL